MSKKFVLVVDDDVDIRNQLKEMLSEKYDVGLASSGKECLLSIEKQRPDCIIMDVMMDDLCDGLETTKQIKESENTKNIPVILLTSVNKSFDYREQVDTSYFPHNVWIDKPVKADRLLRELELLMQ